MSYAVSSVAHNCIARQSLSSRHVFFAITSFFSGKHVTFFLATSTHQGEVSMEVETDGGPFKLPAFGTPEVEDAVPGRSIPIGQKVKLLSRQPCSGRNERR